MAVEGLLPAATELTAYLARVLDTIARLEQRAEHGERFAQLALPAWRRELERVREGRVY